MGKVTWWKVALLIVPALILAAIRLSIYGSVWVGNFLRIFIGNAIADGVEDSRETYKEWMN